MTALVPGNGTWKSTERMVLDTSLALTDESADHTCNDHVNYPSDRIKLHDGTAEVPASPCENGYSVVASLNKLDKVIKVTTNGSGTVYSPDHPRGDMNEAFSKFDFVLTDHAANVTGPGGGKLDTRTTGDNHIDSVVVCYHGRKSVPRKRGPGNCVLELLLRECIIFNETALPALKQLKGSVILGIPETVRL